MRDRHRGFKQRPGKGTYRELKNAVMDWRSRVYHVENKELESISKWVLDFENNKINVGSQIKWVGCDFAGTPFELWFGDHELKLELNDELKSAIHDVKDENWTDQLHYELWHVLSGVETRTYPLDFSGKPGSDGLLTFRLTDHGHSLGDKVARGVISFWDLLAKRNGNFDYKLHLKMEKGGDVTKPGPVVTLRFFDVPVCP